jgi:opacity protein-like surface antigen
MRKSFILYLFSCLFFTAIIVCSTNSYAENNTEFPFLLRELGVSHLSYLNLEPISDIPQGRVIRCWVTDPAKLDVFKNLEDLELKKIEGNKWELKNPDTGSNVAFTIKYKEDGKIEVIKTASYISPKRVVSSPSDQLNLQGFYIGGGASYAWENFDTSEIDFLGNVSIDDAWGLNAFAGYRFTRYIALEGNFNWYDDFDAKINGFDFQVKIWTLMLDLKAMYPVYNDRLVPYVRIGGGYMDGEIEVAGLNESDEDFAFNLGGGLDYYVTDLISLGLDGKYVWGTGDLDDLEYFVGTANVAFHF